ncbi:MAG: leucine-rich repeat protein [Bacteroidaceae bacterium]|nr:leucine-rich repeat protein [Bacteroidaceae bacterium]
MKLDDVLFADGIKTIGESAFGNCITLNTVFIPATVETLGYNCFNNCYKLADFTIRHESPLVVNNNVFEGCALKNAVLNVPIGTIEKYKEASVWSEFGIINEV